MYELNNKVRLIDVTTFPVRGYDAFIGFICGIISQDHDLEQMYLDSFLKLSGLEGQDLKPALSLLEQIGKKYEAKGSGDPELVYSDGSAEFSINKEGQLIWKDLKDDAGKGKKFDRLLK